MSDWVRRLVSNSPEAAESGLASLAEDMCKRLGVCKPEQGSPGPEASLETLPFTQQPVHLTGDAISSAKEASVNIEVKQCVTMLILNPLVNLLVDVHFLTSTSESSNL